MLPQIRCLITLRIKISIINIDSSIIDNREVETRAGSQKLPRTFADLPTEKYLPTKEIPTKENLFFPELLKLGL